MREFGCPVVEAPGCDISTVFRARCAVSVGATGAKHACEGLKLEGLEREWLWAGRAQCVLVVTVEMLKRDARVSWCGS